MSKKISQRIGAGLMAGLCAALSLNGSFPSAAAAEQQVLPTADTVIAKAATLLGTKYGFGYKGYDGVYYQGAYTALDESMIRAQGVDCSGLVYWTMTQLGYSTSGFSWNNPNPVDTYHWLSYNESCTITYDGVTAPIIAEKVNMTTSGHGYWECADGSTIQPGSVVVYDNPTGYNHAWLYMGEFDSRDAVISYLHQIGVADSLINAATVGNGLGAGGKHWRIESNGAQGVVINNNVDGKDANAFTCSAFQITGSEMTFSIYKVDENTQKAVGSSPVDHSPAVYGIYSDPECKGQPVTLTIGADGTGSVNLPNGTYYAKELSAPTGYALNPTVYPLTSGETVTVSEDWQRGKIIINKTAEDDEIADISFSCIGSNGLEASEKTNADGIAVFENLPVYDVTTGKLIEYTVSENHPDAKYVVPEPQTVTLQNGDADLTVMEKFENRLKKFTVTVTKQDAETGTAQGEATLAGAVYGLYCGDKLLDQYTTDENGAFTTKSYICGDEYTVQEITPSKGYLLDETVYPVGAEAKPYTIENNSIALTVQEQAVKGYVEMIKVSADGTTGIETPENGAEFDVYLKSAGSYDEADDSVRDHLICDENGHAVTKALPYGVYTVHQTAGWESTEWVADFDVQITENEKTYPFVINDAVKTAQLRIVKKDAESKKTIPVSGVGFQIWSDALEGYIAQTVTYPANQTIDTFYTDETGTLMLPQPLSYGSYRLEEVHAPEGYALNTETVSFSVDGEETVIEIECFDTPQKGRISVQKTGEQFSHVTCLAPAIWQDADGQQHTAGRTTYYPEFAESGLAGAKFAVVAAEDIVTADGTVHARACDVVAEIVTDENGYAETGLLYLGKYSVREILAPAGYVLNAEPKTVELTYAGQEFSIRDTVNQDVCNTRQRVQIVLEKFMEQDEEFGIRSDYSVVSFGLFAAEEIKAADGTVIPADGFLDSVRIGADHTAKFTTEIPFGKYYVQEITTDENYVLNGEKYPVNFAYMGQEMTTVQIDCGLFTNTMKRGSISGKKTDPNGKELEGAVFGLFTADAESFDADSALRTAITDKNGAFAFERIPCGDYIICEIAPPTGYIVSDVKYPVTITEDGQMVSIEAENKPVSINLRKQDLYGNELEGAEMRVETADGVLFDAWTSDGSSHVITAIPAGSYVLIEQTAPEGYLVATEIRFTVHADGTVTVDNIEVFRDSSGIPTVIMKDDATKVCISKQTITGNEELPGATMQVVDKDGNTVDEWISEETPHNIIALLTAGETYTIHEAAAPDGYLVATDIVFTVEQDGSVTVDGITVDAQSEDGIPMLVMKDDATKVCISKQTITGDEELPGATMQIVDKDENTVDEWISSETPHDIIALLTAGETYTIHEVAAPDGYLVATDIVFTVEADGSVTVDGITVDAQSEDGVPVIIMKDDATKVTVSKRDMTTSEELPGAALQVIDKDGNIVEDWVSADKPHEITAKLTAGETYTLKEIIAPDGYQIAESVQFTVKDDGNITYVVMYDQKIVHQTVKTNDTTTTVPSWIMIFAGAVIIGMLVFTKKKEEHND